MADDPREFESLKARMKGLENTPELRHRLHRALSWLERADSANDADAKCIFLWVAFNAAYAIDHMAECEEWGHQPREWERQEKHFERLTRTPDGFRRIRSAIRTKLWNPVERLMSNEYIFWGFWASLTDAPFDWMNWERKGQFEAERTQVMRRLRHSSAGDTKYVLTRLFDRLNTLRNQLMHGCATRAGSLNRRQVEDGAEVLRVLVPLFLDIMTDHLEVDWGRISFPVRDDIREDRR